jgi:ParB-like chromosome segregation protein Spo0J
LSNLTEPLKQAISDAYDNAEDKQDYLNELKDYLYQISPRNTQPIDFVRWVPVEQVQANDYNPNSVAGNEMRLLYTSISHDGYTQPVVTVYDPEIQKYVIVDGFHRYTIMRRYEDIYKLNNGRLPIVVIDKSINDRMASTIRHNRARGKHRVDAMSDIVVELKRRNWSDAKIGKELGMDADEVLRLAQLSGIAELFSDEDFSEAWDIEGVPDDADETGFDE